MKTKAEITELCLTFGGSYEDHPFRTNTLNYSTIRHLSNKKIFALIVEKDGQVLLNLKTEPMHGDFMKQVYSSIVPAYHMNKQHWITVILDGSVPLEEITNLISNSYELTKKKTNRKK